MSLSGDITLTDTIPETGRRAAARLFWQAFQGKLGPLMTPDEKALAFLERVLDPTHGIAAVDGDGRVVGIAGFKTSTGALIGGELSDLQSVYGTFGGLWRGVLLSLLERPLADDVLLMDGISVDESARGQGLGTALLAAIKTHAAELGKDAVRLDVIDTNPRARALYERQGFQAMKTEHIGPLRLLFGFRSATQMRFDLNA